MACNLGQHTYEEKGEEQSWVTEHIQSGQMFTQSVVEHQEKLHTVSRVHAGGARSLHGTSKHRELRE